VLAYGELRIHPLPEGRFTVGADKRFVPHDARDLPKGTLFVSVTPFLVVTPSDVVLIDTGLGDYATGRDTTFLLDGLRRAGYEREDVTRVILSHLHFDHCGGAVIDAGGHDIPTFPHAAYFLQRGEAASEGYRDVSAEARDRVIHTLEAAGQLELLDGRAGLTPSIEVEETGGHTAHHQIVRLHSGGLTAIFGGDVLAAPSQATRSFRAKYDVDPRRSQAERKRLVREAAENGHLLLFYHSTSQPYGFVVEDQRGVRFEPAEVQATS
jgi:glyoxylase-like metal-dependent hydrolase (beta-lactamase superfamily II)